MSKVLITGGAGFLGAYLGDALSKQGFEVDLLDNLARGRRDAFLGELIARDGVQVIERDLAGPTALDDLATDYTHVFHFAAIVGVQNVIDRPYATLETNVAMLSTAIEFARRQDRLERLVFPSTSEVYAGSLEHLDMPIPTPETTALALPDLAEPRTSYMLSKICGEAMVRYSTLPFTIVRPHNIYGPRMGLAHVVPQLLDKAHCASDGAAIEVFSVDHSRTFCFIDDAVEMILRAAQAPSCVGETLNVGSQEPEVTMRRLAEIIVETVGRRVEIEAKPATPGSPSRRCPDMTRMADLTGYRARVGLEDGVRRTYEWYRPMVFDAREARTGR